MPLHSLLKIRVRWISLLIMLCLLNTTSADANTSGVSDLQTKAARGYVKQQLELAADYFAGRGVPKDLTQSAYWYRKAADQGNPAAQVYLGYMYTGNEGECFVTMSDGHKLPVSRGYRSRITSLIAR
jgi:TPR repeat protein